MAGCLLRFRHRVHRTCSRPAARGPDHQVASRSKNRSADGRALEAACDCRKLAEKSS